MAFGRGGGQGGKACGRVAVVYHSTVRQEDFNIINKSLLRRVNKWRIARVIRQIDGRVIKRN